MSDDPITAGGAADRAERLTHTIRDQTFPNLRPRDAATLIVIDRTTAVPKVLLGRRHTRHRFMPGKFVFPGGRIEIADRAMPVATPLEGRDLARLMQKIRRPSITRAAAFALAAVRETYEETGLMLGRRSTAGFATPTGPWQAFSKEGVTPDLGTIHFVARAITPPKRPLRFDSRFFAVDSSAIAHRAEGFVGPDAEFIELVWLPITEAHSLDMPGITMVVLEELQERIANGMSRDPPVPLYRMVHKRFVRELL
jgi:8-oxo-dGTP pyrophosphatase MutT (NUDIX family)